MRSASRYGMSDYFSGVKANRIRVYGTCGLSRNRTTRRSMEEGERCCTGDGSAVTFRNWRHRGMVRFSNAVFMVQSFPPFFLPYIFAGRLTFYGTFQFRPYDLGKTAGGNATRASNWRRSGCSLDERTSRRCGARLHRILRQTARGGRTRPGRPRGPGWTPSDVMFIVGARVAARRLADSGVPESRSGTWDRIKPLFAARIFSFSHFLSFPYPSIVLKKSGGRPRRSVRFETNLVYFLFIFVYF